MIRAPNRNTAIINRAGGACEVRREESGMNENGPLGLGLVGCGSFGDFCMGAFSSLDSVHLAAVADVRGEAAEQFGRNLGVPAFDDPLELITRGDVHIVHVATPPSTHHALTMAAIKAGKHVLCEKPLATSLRDADEIVEAAVSAAVVVPVNFVLRYNPVSEAVGRIIESGAMGKVLSAHLTNCAGDTPLEPAHWFWDKSVSGGIFIEHGVHFFDLYSDWLGPGAVMSSHREIREGTRQEDRVMCAVRHDSGAVATHYHGFDQMSLMDRTDHRLVFETGDVRVDGWIPLSLTVDAAVDDEAVSALVEICGGCDVQTLETYDAQRGATTGRGKQRNVTKRIRVDYCPQPDKQSLYAESVRALLADQIAFIRDRSHARRITEANGRDAVAVAEAAVKMAERS